MSAHHELLPAGFPEANTTLTAPPGMADCGPLPTWRDGHECISRWRLPWRARVLALLGGDVWLRVVGVTQPPVALEVSRRGPFVVAGHDQ